MQILQPAGWKRPKGYANGVAASGRMLFVAGQVGWDADEVFRRGPRRADPPGAATCSPSGRRRRAFDRHRAHDLVPRRPPSTTPASEIGTVYRDLIGHHYRR